MVVADGQQSQCNATEADLKHNIEREEKEEQTLGGDG